MRQLAYLVVIGMAIAGAVLGPLAFSPRTKEPAAAAATGELVYRSGTYSVRLTEQPCPFYEAREPLEAEGIPPAKWAFVTQGERRYTICWARDIDNDVLTLDQDGNGGHIPKEWLTR